MVERELVKTVTERRLDLLNIYAMLMEVHQSQEDTQISALSAGGAQDESYMDPDNL